MSCFARMRRLIAWGNNAAGSIDPGCDAVSVTTPVDLTVKLGCDEVLWHGWACSVLKKRSSGAVVVIGTDEIIDDEQGRTLELAPQGGCQRILGFDRPRGYLDYANFARTWDGSRSPEPWREVAVTQLGMTLAWSEAKGLVQFSTLEDLLQGLFGEPMEHPLFDSTRHCRIFATESRAFVHQHSGLDLIFEVITNRGGRPCPPALLPIEGFEGAAIGTVQAAPGNRLAIVSAAGQAFLLGKYSHVAEPWDCSDDVRLFSVLSNGELAVGEEKIWVTGRSKCGELGYRNDTADQDDSEMGESLLLDRHRWPPNKIRAITSSRWSAIMTIDDEL